MAGTSLTDEPTSRARKSWKRPASRTPAMPTTRCAGKPVTFFISYTIASSGFEMTMTKAFGHFVFTFSATLRMSFRLMVNKSSRDMPGLRGTPAVTMTTSAPAQSSQLDAPLLPASWLCTAPFCSRSSALPLARPSFSGMSNSTTSPSSLRATRAASSPPMFPAPIKAIFLRDMLGAPFGEVAVRELQILDDGVAERRARHLGRALHQPREVVRDALLRDGLL